MISFGNVFLLKNQNKKVIDHYSILQFYFVNTFQNIFQDIQNYSTNNTKSKNLCLALNLILKKNLVVNLYAAVVRRSRKYVLQSRIGACYDLLKMFFNAPPPPKQKRNTQKKGELFSFFKIFTAEFGHYFLTKKRFLSPESDQSLQ